MSDLKDFIEIVACHYWGNPNEKLSSGDEIRFGTNGSKTIHIPKGIWYDFENEVGGGVVDLVRQGEGLSQGQPVADILREKFGLEKVNYIPPSDVASFYGKYDYFDKTGEISYQVQRLSGKRFLQRRPDGQGGWIYNLKGVEPLPYRLPMILECEADTIFIVEGEKCADAMLDEDFLATTNSGGAGNWKPELNQYFAGRDVVILPDNDEPGKRHANLVASSLFDVAASIRIVEIPDLPPKGDVADWFADGASAKELKALVAMTDRLTAPPALADCEPSKEDYFQFLTVTDLKMMSPPEWLIDDVITNESLCVLYGAPGTGKSFIALDMALSIANGREWHDKPVKKGQVLYIAGEGHRGLGKRVNAWQLHHSAPGDSNIHFLSEPVKFSEEQDIDRLIASVDAFDLNFDLVVVDTVARSLSGVDENSAADMGLFVEACDRLKRHCNASILAVHHAGKDQSRGMRGSSALLGAVDTSLCVTKDEKIVTIKMEKQKDAEQVKPLQFQMLEVALFGDSSIVMKRIEGPAGGRHSVKLSARQFAALQALRNLLIDQVEQKVPVSAWHEAHGSKSPDLSPTQRKDARQGLQDKGVVVVDSGTVWIHRETEGRVWCDPRPETD